MSNGDELNSPEALALLKEIRGLLRGIAKPNLDDLDAADTFRKAMLDRADSSTNGSPLWYGWVIVEAFMAGAKHARSTSK